LQKILPACRNLKRKARESSNYDLNKLGDTKWNSLFDSLKQNIEDKKYNFMKQNDYFGERIKYKKFLQRK